MHCKFHISNIVLVCILIHRNNKVFHILVMWVIKNEFNLSFHSVLLTILNSNFLRFFFFRQNKCKNTPIEKNMREFVIIIWIFISVISVIKAQGVYFRIYNIFMLQFFSKKTFLRFYQHIVPMLMLHWKNRVKYWINFEKILLWWESAFIKGNTVFRTLN